MQSHIPYFPHTIQILYSPYQSHTKSYKVTIEGTFLLQNLCLDVPPGQDPSKIRPARTSLGRRMRWPIKNAAMGISVYWHIQPIATDVGRCKTRTNSCVLSVMPVNTMVAPTPAVTPSSPSHVTVPGRESPRRTATPTHSGNMLVSKSAQPWMDCGRAKSEATAASATTLSMLGCRARIAPPPLRRRRFAQERRSSAIASLHLPVPRLHCPGLSDGWGSAAQGSSIATMAATSAHFAMRPGLTGRRCEAPPPAPACADPAPAQGRFSDPNFSTCAALKLEALIALEPPRSPSGSRGVANFFPSPRRKFLCI